MIKIITSEQYQRFKIKALAERRNVAASLLKHACAQSTQTISLDMIFSHIILVRRATTQSKANRFCLLQFSKWLIH